MASKTEQQIKELEKFIKSRGLEEQAPKESKPFGALRAVGGALNIGTSIVAGATRGAIREDVSIIDGIKQGIKNRETFGFSDVIREDILKKSPQTRAGKVAVGLSGFAADVAFDPLTYLTLGTGAGLKVGAKAGAKTLTKQGTKLAQKASRELIEAGVKGRKAERTAKFILTRATGKKGLPKEAVQEFIERGVTKDTINAIAEGGKKLVDEGGIKMVGKTLISSDQIANSPVGKIARKLGETETVKTLKETLGKTFVPDFKRSPAVVSILDNANRKTKAAMQGIIKANKELFDGLSDRQMVALFDEIFEKKLEIISGSKEIQEKAINELKNSFPKLKVSDRETAIKILNNLEDDTVRQISDIRAKVDEIVKPFFDERKAAIKAGKTLPNAPGLTGETALKSFAKVDELNKVVEGLKTQLSKLRKQKGKSAKLGKRQAVDLGGEITEQEVRTVANRLIDFEEQRLSEVIEQLSKKIENLKGKKSVGGKKLPPLKKATITETIVFAERLIQKLQDDLLKKTRALETIIDSRKLAKAKQRGERITFDDPKLQQISDKLFEGKDAIVPRFAKLAGLNEDEAIKFYIPSKFRNKIKLKESFIGNKLSGVDADFLKEFKGVQTDDLIKNPFELYSRGQVEVVTARIKSDTARTIVRKLGRPLKSLTQEQAESIGFKKFNKKVLGGRVEGWVPASIHEDLTGLFTKDLKSIDELARVTGFDYVTGIFKGYVTSLFPGFHIRNITSNNFQNMIKFGVNAFNPRFQIQSLELVLGRNLDKVITTKTGKKITLKEIREMIKKNSNVLDESGPFGDLEQFITKGKLDIPNERKALSTYLQKFNPLSRENIALEKGRAFGSAAEAQAKTVGIIASLVEGKSIKEAIKLSEEALFNYGKLTGFERSVMRRLIPFYTFARKNAEFQVRALATNPGRVAAQIKGIKGFGETIGEPVTEEDIEGLPDFILENLGIKAGANKFGQSTYLIGLGLPIEEFLGRFSGDKSIIVNTFKNVLTQMNPILKLPAERAVGVDFFRERPIADITNAQDLKPFLSLLNSMSPKAAKQLKKQINFVELKNQPVYVDGRKVDTITKYRANPFALHILRNLPTSRFQSTVGFLSEEEEAGFNKMLRVFTGVRGFSIDQERQKFFNDLERQRELQNFLVQMGLHKRYETTFESD